jgi:WhiB family redox-sensing transcriptional regulator
VRGECLEAALERHETYGIWGGLNELERRALLRT